jgi:calcium/calmodulin-dependent protein kinase I
MWAIGIIMHKLLTGGKHPIYSKGVDSYQSFKEKLQTLKKVDPDPSLSEIAQNLFKRLVCVQASHRYNANECLQHPWITRKMDQSIPMSFIDQMQNLEFERMLRQKMLLLQFMAVTKMT